MPNIVRFGEYYCLFVSVEQKNHLNLNTFIRCEEMKKIIKIINLYEYFRVGVRMLTPEYFLLKIALLYGWLYCNNTKVVRD